MIEAESLKRSAATLERVLRLVSVMSSAGYLLTDVAFNLMRLKSEWWSVAIVLKGLAVSTLALIAWYRLSGKDRWQLVSALVLSSLGDVLLAVRREGFFVCGLLSFLIAHLFYILLFVSHWPKSFSVAQWKKMLVAMVVAFAVVMAWRLLPVGGGLSVPVTVYLMVLTTMVIAAILAKFESRWIVIGAILFMISDSLIAVTRFKGLLSPAPAGVLIWTTYYIAQYLIAFGVMNSGHSR
jgi:uncharacterized membrane protein YhhN